MTEYLKLQSNTVTLNATANDISSAKLVRIVNLNTSPILITQAVNATSNLYTTIIPASSVVYLMKSPGHLLYSNGTGANVSGQSIGFFGA